LLPLWTAFDMPSDQPVTYRARYLFPVDAPPISGGCVTIERSRIVAVDASARGQRVIDLGNVAILPGLVNAHTHLEFSDFAQPLGKPGIGFADWLRLVIDYRRSSPERNVPESVRQGLLESQRGGVAALGEIATSGWSPIPFDESPIRATVFGEIINLKDEVIEQKVAEAEAHLDFRAGAHGSWVSGISPHAPYTVHRQLLPRLVDVASRAGSPLAMHLAESREELELLESGSGPLRTLLEERRVWNGHAIAPGSRPLDYLRQLARTPRSLVIHGNYLNAEEILFAGEHAARMSVVYCPRTHAYFGHEPYPLAALLSVGATVALGTDSRASNPDLGLFEEIRFVAEHHPIWPAEALKLGSLGGAKALGITDKFGSILPGKRARLTLVQLPNHDAADPHELLLDHAAKVQRLPP
jgi:cytosine/adenosine deaminase-related metal-dependent hydrolase